MKKAIVAALVLVLTLGVLGGCSNTESNNNNNANNNTGSDANNSTNNNNAMSQSSRTAAETVLLYADLSNALDYKGLLDVLYEGEGFELDSEGYTFVSMDITVQNPNAQMEPEEIEFYQGEVDDLIDTAIICAEVRYVYTSHETNKENEYVKYLDFYLIRTEAHPDWMITYWTNQAGY